MELATPPSPPTVARSRRYLGALRARLPPVRLLWIFLIVLGAYGVNFLGSWMGLAPLIALPAIAVITDVLFARARFERMRFPDSALATGLLLALLFPPVVPLVAAGAATIAAVSVKNVLRFRGRPWFNPAASGVLVGAVLFGLSPAWWGSIDETLVVALGAALILWNYRSWRIPVSFLTAYALFAVTYRAFQTAALGGIVSPGVLLLAAFDPSILFFAFFMVAEPRTAPKDSRSQPLYAVGIAGAAALLPTVLPTLAVFVGLIAGNAFVLFLRYRAERRSAPSTEPSTAAEGGSLRRRLARPTVPAIRKVPVRWSVGRRAAAGFIMLILVAWVAAASYNPATSSSPLLRTPGTGGFGGSSGTQQARSHCSNDNASIPKSELNSLHHTLGPSVILSYSPSNGFVVFYDPVNQVTITETDLYEDFGYAEFNGDDYSSTGCVPP
ncbi:MAG: RnfABCDGE type electron transport complex subunit D [Thermoplasmata archaeon]|nr:RnfABCDGE type electron transport complex subunit D [Thermoplasmata archaeon]